MQGLQGFVRNFPDCRGQKNQYKTMKRLKNEVAYFRVNTKAIVKVEVDSLKEVDCIEESVLKYYK